MRTDPVEALLAEASPETRAIIQALRALIHRVLPEAHEFIYHAALHYALTEAAALPTRICSIVPLKTQVNLTFFAGEALRDPQHLLVGTKRRSLRHVPVKTLEAASNPALEHLLSSAWGQGWMGQYR